MDFTNDIFLNGRHANTISTFGLKRTSFTKKVLDTIKENKFITTILFTMTIFITIDIALINTFINILTKLY